MTIDELSRQWTLEIIPDVILKESENYFTLVGAYAQAYETCSRYWHADRTREQANAYLHTVILPALHDHNRTPITDYTKADLEEAIERIKERGQVSQNKKGKYVPYSDSTIQRFREILARIFTGCSLMGYCEDILRDSYFLMDPQEVKNPANTILLMKKSLSVEIEIRLIDYLLSDYKAEGEVIGFLLVVACGLRIIESSAAIFGNIIPLMFHPNHFKLLVFETGTALSEMMKSGGKSRNASRAIPLFDRVVQFLIKRKEYIGEELKKQGIEADVNTLPIACSGKDFLKGCTTKQISDKAREIFAQFGIEPKVFQYIDAEMTFGDLKEIKEKNPTGYLGRHIFATHLAVCDLSESEIQAVIGHEIEDRNVTRNDFSNDEIIYKIKNKMDRLPLYRTVFKKVCISGIDGHISGNGPLDLLIDEPVKYMHVSVECEEPFDVLTIEMGDEVNGQIVVGFKQPESRTGIDVMQKYEELYNNKNRQ